MKDLKKSENLRQALSSSISIALLRYPKGGLADLSLAVRAELKARGYRIVKIPAHQDKGEK